MSRLAYRSGLILGFTLLTPFLLWQLRIMEGSLDALPHMSWRWAQLAVGLFVIVVIVLVGEHLQNVSWHKSVLNGVVTALFVGAVGVTVLVLLRNQEEQWPTYAAVAGLGIGIFAAVADFLVNITAGGWR